MPENKTTETTNTSPEKAQEQQKTNTERTRANTNAAEKLQKTAEKPEKKDAGNFSPLGVTAGGDEKLSISTMGPTYTSPDGETSITAGFSTSTERPDPGMRETTTNGVGININTTPRALGNGIKKIGQGIRNLFKKKK